jgi:hypothetical protein
MWLFKYNIRIYEQFVQRLLTSDVRSEQLLTFEIIPGDKAKIEDFPLLYDTCH